VRHLVEQALSHTDHVVHHLPDHPGARAVPARRRGA
jgi:hypothetical protein